MRILHTEASQGWGGQEMRILHEAVGMRERGHEVLFAVASQGELVTQARAKGFTVWEIPFTKKTRWQSLKQLYLLLKKHPVDLINTHSSVDAWVAGIVAKWLGVVVVRTRHISSFIRPGVNSWLLYNWLADCVVTTCEDTEKLIQQQAHLSSKRCRSIPTGVNPDVLQVDPALVADFRAQYGILPSDCLVGTLCIIRRWKGIGDFLSAAKILKEEPHLKWMIVGSGPSYEKFQEECRDLDIGDRIIFTGHLHPPYTALAAMDLVLLLSTASEGVSQATLQAAYLKKPLITTPVGGLKEVCLPGTTGLQVEPSSPLQVAEAVRKLARDRTLRSSLGAAGRALVEEKFTFSKTLDAMEEMYHKARKA